VLDTITIRLIIYIWYEGGELIATPSEARLQFELAPPPGDRRGRCLEATSADIR